MNLIQTVRRRYSRAAITGREFTLVHRVQKTAPPQPESKKKSGLLSLFMPRIKDEQSRATKAFAERLTRMEKTELEHFKTTGKRIDLVLAETNKRLLALSRITDTMTRRERDKKRELEATPREELPISAKQARRMVEHSAVQSDEKLEEAIKRGTRKSVNAAVRRIRDEEEYERMRGGQKA